MMKVDAIQDGSVVKTFDYTFKSSNQTYRIILSLLDNYSRFTINMTEKIEKICFATEFKTADKVNKCSNGIFNRIDFFYYNVLNIFETGFADGIVKDKRFQMVLPICVLNRIENMIIDVDLVENDEIWRLKQTILDLREELLLVEDQAKPEIISFEENVTVVGNSEQPLFVHKSKKRGNALVNVNFSYSDIGTELTTTYNIQQRTVPQFGLQSNMVMCTNKIFSAPRLQLLVGKKSYEMKEVQGQKAFLQFSMIFDGNTEIKAIPISQSTITARLNVKITITPQLEFVYTKDNGK